MNQTEFNSLWDNVKGEIKNTWGELTDSEIKKIDGQKDKLISLLESKYGLARDKAETKLDAFLETVKSSHNERAIGDGIRHAGDKIQEYSYQVADKANTVSDKTYESLGKINEKAHDQFDESYEKITGYVKNNPVKSALFGLSAGVLIGRLMK